MADLNGLNDFSDFSDDDDDQFIALTMKPATQAEQSSAEKELLTAKGEISILRSRLNQIIESKNALQAELTEKINKQTDEYQTNLKLLQDSITNLEQERKFLTVEIRNLSSKKRKRVSEEVSQPSAPPQNTQAQPLPPVRQNQGIKLLQLKSNSETDQLINHILNTTIPGSGKSTQFLSKIYTIKSKIIANNKPINEILIDFLFQTKIFKLDLMISKTINYLMSIIEELLNNEEIISIPFLLSIIHSIICFRPVAINSKISEFLILQILKLIKNFLNLIKPVEEDEVRIEFLKYNFQNKFIKKITLNYSFDVLEKVQQFNKLPIDLNLLKISTTKNSNLNIIFNSVKILNYLNINDDQINFNLINLVFDDSFNMSSHLNIYSLNRCIGNNNDILLISQLFKQDELTSQPLTIEPLRNDNDFKFQNNFETQLINLKLNIIYLFTKIINKRNDSNLIKDESFFKKLILTVSKQQEIIINSARNNLTHLRIKLISSIIKLIYLIWETTISLTKKSPVFSKDLLHYLFVIFARIGFSINVTKNEAISFFNSFKNSNPLSFNYLFNKWSEERSFEIFHLNKFDSSLINISNGIEFQYDEEIILLARDLLEKTTTMDEADRLYAVMNQI